MPDRLNMLVVPFHRSPVAILPIGRRTRDVASAWDEASDAMVEVAEVSE
ncbi:hypothetical protein [Muricoccus pecuniae]|uniref:Uncharacterized protein n=1 Tax=Muricoccus pecuniae TaxID=693023 RepID=A0A840Y3U2_9PROT|nr:hypothetical protein [Roseomonas pecuniae]MBB5694380.1 hypothetical protein [Roseomonas pecuniae]